MVASLKKSGQCFACGLILFPASLTSGVKGDKEWHLRSGSIQPNNNHKLICFLKQCSCRLFDHFPRSGNFNLFFSVCFLNSVSEFAHFQTFLLSNSHSVCILMHVLSFYLCVGAEHMALYFIHRVHPISNSSKMEPSEHHFILGKSPW